MDYTPVLTIHYDCLPADLKHWEKRDSWLLCQETRKKIKEAKASLVAKSIEKEKSIASITWRLSLNAAPVVQKAIDSLRPRGCNIKKILRLIKDMKTVAFALNPEDKDYLKSYNVKQAMLWFLHANPDVNSDVQILHGTFSKLQEFYKKKYLPSFLEPKRNLIFKMVKTKKTKDALEKITEVINNACEYIDMVKRKQDENFEGIKETRNTLRPVKEILLFPVISQLIADKTAKGLNKSLKTRSGDIRHYFEEDRFIKIFDKKEKKFVNLCETQALKCIILEWLISVLRYRISS